MPPFSDRVFIRLGQYYFEGGAEGRYAINAFIFVFSLIAIVVSVWLFTAA